MDIEERKFYEGYIYDVLKFSFEPMTKKFKDSKNRINNCLEIAYYLKGRDVTRLGKKIFVNTPDTIKISPPYNQTRERHEVKSEEECEIIDIGIITPYSFSDKIIVIDVSAYPKIKELFVKIYNIWSAKHDNYFFDATAVYYSLLKEIYGILNHSKPLDGKYKKLHSAVKYIHSNFDEKSFSCNHLPKMCGWGHAYFYKIFEKQFKTTPQKYITSLRMQRAVELLFENKLSITAIADRCGYESVAYFSRVFKKYYGVSPSRYNQKI